MTSQELMAAIDFETNRTPAKLCRWIEEVLDLFDANEETKADFRLRKGKIKKFVEEIIPASIYLTLAYGDDRTEVSFRPNFGSQNYDSEVIGTDGEILEFVECTCAINGYAESLRAEAINTDQTPVDAYEMPQYSGKRGNRIFKKNFSVHEFGEILNTYRRLINDAINEKMRDPNRYTPNYVLLVAFEDTLIRDKCYLEDLIRDLRFDLGQRDSKFKGVFLICTHRRIAIQLDNIGVHSQQNSENS